MCRQRIAKDFCHSVGVVPPFPSFVSFLNPPGFQNPVAFMNGNYKIKNTFGFCHALPKRTNPKGLQIASNPAVFMNGNPEIKNTFGFF